MLNHVEMCLIKFAGWDNGFKLDVRLFPSDFGANQSQALRNAVNVRIYREGWFVEGKKQHNCRRLRSDTLKVRQPGFRLVNVHRCQKVNIDGAALLGYLSQRALDHRAFSERKSRRTYEVNYLGSRRVANLFPRSITRPDVLKSLIAIYVRRVLAQNGVDQLVHGRQVLSPCGESVAFRQEPRNDLVFSTQK